MTSLIDSLVAWIGDFADVVDTVVGSDAVAALSVDFDDVLFLRLCFAASISSR